MKETKEQSTLRWHVAAGKVQSGIAWDIQIRGEAGAAANPKHLRVGVNVALTDQASFARLLITKGLITEEEYLTAIADGMEAEVARIEKDLTSRLGRPVVLGEAGSDPTASAGSPPNAH